mgnify:FL=1
MKKLVRPFLLLVIVTLLVLSGCGPSKPANEAPKITNTSPASPASVEVGKQLSFSAVATDPNNDTLAYKWTTTKGTFNSTTGTDVIWTAPNTVGSAQVTVTVSDGKLETKYTWTVNVIAESNTILITENIALDTTWKAGKTYIVNDITLNAHLTIEPGTIIKFKENCGLTVDTAGSITAVGTSALPIIFTSIRDDAHGGDTNKDGSNSKPAVADWSFIDLYNSRFSTFTHCQFYYGGSGYRDSVLTVNLAKATIDNCTFAFNKGTVNGALDLAGALQDTIVTNNKFYQNIIPLVINAQINIDNSNVFKDPNNPAVTNTKNGIFLYNGDYYMRKSLSWQETEVPFVITNDLNIDSGFTLSLSPGVVVKFQEGFSLTVEGSLKAKGTASQPIVFTSYRDDRLTDTNGDGTVTKPNASDWQRLSLDNSPLASNEFEYCQFLYGGKSSGIDSVLRVYFTDAILNNCTFAYSNGSEYGALYLGNANKMTINSCTFYGNEIPLVINTLVDVAPGNKFFNPNNTAIKNTKNGIFVSSDSYTFDKAVNWTETAVPYVIPNYMDIDTTGKITLGTGAIIKFMIDAGFSYSGSNLVNYSSAKFTAYSDDTLGGDTNADGSSSGYASYWDGIYNYNSGIYANWSNIYFAANK